jgi:hypothetical protein
MSGQEERKAQGQRKYYSLEIDFAVASKTPAHEWLNQREQMRNFYPYPDRPFCGIRFFESPQIQFERKRAGVVLRDAWPVTLGIWLISDRLKKLLEQLDPDAFTFQKVDVDWSAFPEPSPDFWFVYIVRTLDCVDEEHSVINYQDDIPGIKNYLALIDVKMRPELVGSAHAFRLKHATNTLIVDDVIVATLKAQKIRGFKFEPIQK